MLRNYLLTAVRIFWRQRIYAVLNVAGLAVALCAFTLLFLFIRHEMSYDRFHPESDRLYRVIQDVKWGEGGKWAWSGSPMGPALAADFEEIEAFARFHKTSLLVGRLEEVVPIRHEEAHFAFVDPSFLSLTGFRIIAGDAGSALSDPTHLILTETTARRYFGGENPLGKTLTIGNRHHLMVAAVVQDPPSNTHLTFDFLASYAFLSTLYGPHATDNWWWPAGSTFVRLAAGTDVARFNATLLPAFNERHREEPYAGSLIPQLQPVTGIHLHGNPEGDGAMQYVRIFSAIAFVILLIAAFNYMNLATARAAQRASEIGVRKVLGAYRRELAMQFLSEALVLAFGAALLGLVMAEAMLPLFRSLTDIPFDSIFAEVGLVFWLILAGLILGVLAGIYPAVQLSRLRPVRTMASARGYGAERFRKGLIVAQFSISIALIVASLVAASQLRYMQNKSLGFDTEQLLSVPLRDSDIRGAFDAFRHELLQVRGVRGVTATNWQPGVGGDIAYAFSLEGIPEGARFDAPRVLYGDTAFLSEMGIEVTSGRALSDEISTDRQEAFLVNEAALRLYGIDEPIGNSLRLVAQDAGHVAYEKKGRIVGVVRDFHIRSLHEDIRPAVITLAEDPQFYLNMILRIAPDDPRSTVAAVEAAWNRRFPHHPFEFQFVDERIRQNYAADARFSRLIGAFASLAIFIACLGLFGLATFAAERRTKEIGIRRVLGATVTAVVTLLSRDFLKLVAIAAVIAIPIGRYAMGKWLDEYAYRIEISWWIFAAAFTATVVVALLTVSAQAIRAAVRNPVESLKSE